MIAQRVGVGIALATILVQAPRLVLAVLAADRQAVSAEWERALLVVAGVGTALVLTGGNLYLAHTIGSVRRWRGRLAVVWLAVLVSSGGLVVPLIAAGLGGRKLPQVPRRRDAGLGLVAAGGARSRGHRRRLRAGGRCGGGRAGVACRRDAPPPGRRAAGAAGREEWRAGCAAARAGWQRPAGGWQRRSAAG